MQLERFLLISLQIWCVCAQVLRDEVESRILQKQLDEYYKNKKCDQKKHSKPRPKPKPSYFEVRALLVRCSNNHCKKFCGLQTAVNKTDLYVKETDPEHFPKLAKSRCRVQLHNCEKKIKLTVKITNEGIISSKFQYVVLDHVYDPLTDTSARLLYPYVIRIKQTPIIQKYVLLFEHMINAKAREEVHNNDQMGYAGCSTNSKNSTCPAIEYKGKTVPYSTGFCCSCDHNKNLKKQPRNEMEDPPTTYNFNFSSAQKTVHKREVRQKRGGQNCGDNSYSPPGVDPDAYHESAHCLKFANLWYYVYRLRHPQIEHSVQVSVFEKFEDRDCNTKWRDLTVDRPLEVNSVCTPCCHNNEPSATLEYVRISKPKRTYNLKPPTQRILVPEIRSGVENLEEVKGGPPEYLVIPRDLISSDGKSCNKVGVSFEGFFKQPKRCAMPQGSCLSNQPSDLWKHDHLLDVAGKTGDYFLKYFGELPESSVQKNGTNLEAIRLYYTKPYKNVLEMDIKADFNAILKPNTFSKVTEIYTDWTYPTKISLTVKIANSGMIASVFFIRLTNCPMKIPATFNNIQSKAVLIPPQHQHIFNIHIENCIDWTTFFCSIQVVNLKNEIVALRRIRFEKFDRCLCMWYCKCACLYTDGAIKCQPLEINSYCTAGFQGGQPVPVHVMDYTLLDEVISILGYLLLFLFMTLLIMGSTKALIGWCAYPAVGLWGLDAILNIRRSVCDKKECVCTLTSDELPVSKSTLFCINVIFFFIYPFAVSFNVLRNLCFSSEGDEVCKCCADNVLTGSDSQMSRRSNYSTT